MQIVGTAGSMRAPAIARKQGVWTVKQTAEGETTRETFPWENILALQIGHCCRVLQGREEPVVPGEEGLRNLEVIDRLYGGYRT